MTQTSLTRHVAPLSAGAHVTGAAFLGRTPALALGDGTVLLGEGDAQRRVAAHPDAAILVAGGDGARLLSGGDDGRVVETREDGSAREIAHEKGRWIDALAWREDGVTAWAAGKQVRARDAKGEVKSWSAPGTVRGLAFMPKGYRLAAAHYNGVSLWFPNLAADVDFLEWKGAHHSVTLSPDGKFAVSAMQENSLHGWRIADRKNMKMTGYPGKVQSVSWSHDGKWLATSGAEACIVWPFSSTDGPMGKKPRECGVRPARVSRVAFHPSALIAALGYDDGWVMLCRLTDASELLVRAPEAGEGGGAVSALCWDARGQRLLFGTAGGEAGLLTLPAA